MNFLFSIVSISLVRVPIFLSWPTSVTYPITLSRQIFRTSANMVLQLVFPGRSVAKIHLCIGVIDTEGPEKDINNEMKSGQIFTAATQNLTPAVVNTLYKKSGKLQTRFY